MPVSDWEFLGSGRYNDVYKSLDGRWVFKIPKYDAAITDISERAVRLWNEINHHIKPRARVVEIAGHKGWICPFIDGKEASDKEISHELIRIYNRTGRIILDASSPNNFLRTRGYPSTIVCVDIGLAIHIELEQELEPERAYGHNLKQVSSASFQVWDQDKTIFTDEGGYFDRVSDLTPEIIRSIKALLFIRSRRPNIVNASFLLNNYGLFARLERAYDALRLDDPTEQFIVHEVEDLLDNVPSKEQQSCVKTLQNYIHSRGSIKNDGTISLSRATRFFRNPNHTEQKIRIANQLIETVEQTACKEDLKQAIASCSDYCVDSSLFYAYPKSRLWSRIDKCNAIVNPESDTYTQGFNSF